MPILLTIILIGAIQGFILSIIFFIKNEIVMNKLFAFIILIISLALFMAYLQNVIDFSSYPFLIKVSMPLSLTFMPLLLIYLQKLTGHTKTNYFYFVPAIILIIYNIPFYFGDEAIKIDYFQRSEYYGELNLIEKLEGLFIEFFVVLFSINAVLESKKYKQKLRQVFSDVLVGKSNWIQFLAYAMLVLTLFSFTLSSLILFIDNTPIELNFITAFGATAIIYIIAYYLLSYPKVFAHVVSATKVIEDKEVFNDKKQLQLADLSEKLLHSLVSEKLYQNPNLTLTELANKADIPPYLVSKVINQHLNNNFFSLVNSYRLEQVKKDLLLEKDKTIIEIAYTAGFNSKTTFYETFKKQTGYSPSQFIQNQHSTQNHN